MRVRKRSLRKAPRVDAGLYAAEQDEPSRPLSRHPRCTNARVTTHVPEAPGVVALALATGCFCGLGGVLAEHLSPACFVRLE